MVTMFFIGLIGKEGIALCSSFHYCNMNTIYQIEQRDVRHILYATHLVCRAGLGSKMDAVISLKLKVIVKYLYDMEGK